MKMKRILSLLLVAVMILSITCVNVFAEETQFKVGDVVEYNLSTFVKEGDNIVERVATDAEKIEYMKSKGREPGTKILIGEKEYEVTEDYKLKLVNIVTTNNTLIQNMTRGTSIPTSRGNLPYSGTYNISSYIYTNKYFNIGYSYNSPSIGVLISADNAQTIGVSYIDMRVNESMGNHSKYLSAGGVWEFLDWVYGGQNFCIKLSNAANNGNWISGDFTVSVDQID